VTDLQRAREFGTSRSTARNHRIARGEPAARKPSPVADAIVDAVNFLGTAHAHEIADHLGKRDRVARVNLYATLPKVAASGRIVSIGGGVYARVNSPHP
jgi:hypothetical protein